MIGNDPEFDALVERVNELVGRVQTLEGRKLVAVITKAENEQPGMPVMIIFNETLANAQGTPYGQNIPGRLAWRKPDGTFELLEIVRTKDPITFREGKAS